MDTGDLLHSYAGVHSANARRIGEIRGELYMNAYNRMGYDAFTPGDLDFAFGVDEIRRLAGQANFPFLLANLLYASSSEPVFTPYLIKNLEGARVGVIGLLSDRLAMGGTPEERAKYRLADPFASAGKWVAELQKKGCQVIVVAAHMDLDELEKLAGAVPGIHFLLSGHYTYYHLDSLAVNGTRILMAGSRGENLGQADFSLKGKDLSARYRLVPLNPQYPDHPQIREMLQQYKSRLQRLAQSQPQPAPQVSTGTSRRHVVIPVNPAYTGEETCRPCHPKQHRQWADSAHARAYQTLVHKGKENDILCLECHTTGYGAAPAGGGYGRNVQCEACHGPAEGHPDMGRAFPKITADVCLRCHNRANSPQFHFPAYRERILHQR